MLKATHLKPVLIICSSVTTRLWKAFLIGIKMMCQCCPKTRFFKNCLFRLVQQSFFPVLYLYTSFFFKKKIENFIKSCLLKAIREYDSKLLLAYHLLRAPLLSKQESLSLFTPATTKLAHIKVNTVDGAFDLKQQLDQLEQIHPWLLTDKLVAKPDQLIKRRGKHGLLCLNKDWKEARQWIEERAGKEIKVRWENNEYNKLLFYA